MDYVALPVSDMARAQKFYGETLGIARRPNYDEHWVEYETENLTIAGLTRDSNHTEGWPDFHTGNVSIVLTDVAKTGDEFRPNGGSIALRVPDVAKTMERLKSEGAEFGYEEVYDSGVCHMAFFKDPDGNALMLRHRYAPYNDGTTP